MAFEPISLYVGPFGGPIAKLGPKYGIFTSQPVWWTIWWPNKNLGPNMAF